MRSLVIVLGIVLVPAVATASSPAICADQEVNFVQEATIGVGCPIYAVNPTGGIAEVRAQINQGPMSAELTPSDTDGIAVTVSTTRCNPDTCEDVTTLTPRSGYLYRYDLPALQVGDIVQLTATLDGYESYAPRLRVTDEPCSAPPTAKTVTACTGTCEYVESCDGSFGSFGCAAGPSRGAAGSWAFPLLMLGVAMACGARRTGRTQRQTARAARVSTRQ